MNDELKPCPNPACRSTDLVVVMNQYAGSFFPRCNACLMTGPAMPTKEAARAAWNALPRAPVWSSEPPKTPGLYGVRYTFNPSESWGVFYDAYSLLNNHAAYYRDKEFAGPYPTPLEASK